MCVQQESENRLYYKGKDDETYRGLIFPIKKSIKQNVVKYMRILDELR